LRLPREAVTGIPPPENMEACEMSPADARSAVAPLTPVCPKSPTLMLVTAPANRALRYALAIFVLLTIAVLRPPA
jgi:hypothetical protein